MTQIQKLQMQTNIHEHTDIQISSYTKHSITVNNTIYKTNIILTKSKIHPLNISIDAITPEILQIASGSELILFGINNSLDYLSKFRKNRVMENISYEIMSLQSAYKTFNYLVFEDRDVALFAFLEIC